MIGTIFDMKRFAVHDGPGIRTTVFLKGCSLSCSWCQNPEGISRECEPWYVGSRCIQCGSCVRSCPNGALAFMAPPDKPRLNTLHDRCTRCGSCVAGCPTGARAFDGRVASVEEVMDEILKDRLFYETSGGGITLSGGEPLMQPEFCSEILHRCQAEGIHTAVESCLCVPTSNVQMVLGVVDLFLVDIKILDPKEHRRHTGHDNVQILDNLSWLTSHHGNVTVRTPLIPGVTATSDNVGAIARHVRSLDRSIALELINFNPLAGQKYGRLGRTYPFAEAKRLGEEEVHGFAALTHEAGVRPPASGPLIVTGITGPVVAIDIGGTKTHVARAFDGRMETMLLAPTPPDPVEAVDMIARAVRDSGAEAIGIGCPGPLDPVKGVVLTPPSLPDWHRFALVDEISRNTGIRVCLENDANAAALGEALLGCAHGYERVLYLTISTGIGCGFVVDGKIYDGRESLAGEIWAFSPGAFAGKCDDTTINDIASGRGLVARAQERLLEGEHSILDKEHLGTREIMAALAEGDPVATAVVEHARRVLAGAVAFALHLLSPDLILIGGGLAANMEWFVRPLQVRVPQMVGIPELGRVPIRRAKLWNEAVLYGALILAGRHTADSTKDQCANAGRSTGEWTMPSGEADDGDPRAARTLPPTAVGA